MASEARHSVHSLSARQPQNTHTQSRGQEKAVSGELAEPAKAKGAEEGMRLNRITGQLQGLRRMVEEERYCIDVLTQIKAAEAALHSLAKLVLRNYLETCVADAFESEDAADRREKIAELTRVFEGMRPK